MFCNASRNAVRDHSESHFIAPFTISLKLTIWYATSHVFGRWKPPPTPEYGRSWRSVIPRNCIPNILPSWSILTVLLPGDLCSAPHPLDLCEMSSSALPVSIEADKSVTAINTHAIRFKIFIAAQPLRLVCPVLTQIGRRKNNQNYSFWHATGSHLAHAAADPTGMRHLSGGDDADDLILWSIGRPWSIALRRRCRV